MEKFWPVIIGCLFTGGITFGASYVAHRVQVATMKQSLKDAHARLEKVEEKQETHQDRIHDQLSHLQEAVAGIESILKFKFKA